MDDYEKNEQNGMNEPSGEGNEANTPEIKPADTGAPASQQPSSSYPYGSQPQYQAPVQPQPPYGQAPVNPPYGYGNPSRPQENTRYPYGQGAQPNTGYPYSPVGGQPQYQAPNQPQPPYQTYQQPPRVAPPKPKKSKKGLALFIILLCFCLVVSVVFAVKLARKGQHNTSVSRGDSVTMNIEDSDAPESSEKNADGSLSATAIYEKVNDSSVGVLVYKTVSGFGGFSSSSGLYTEGTGVIMGNNSAGNATYIITCAHVVSDAGITIKVQASDGEQYDASIVGMDTKTDIAVLSLKKTGLSAAEFGSSSALKVGQKVYAIGNPGGTEFFGSFTSGIISAIARPVDSPVGYEMSCIQHDAAINPGNSGGALINEKGQVIGINSSKIAATNYEGMGFAVPIETVKEIVDDIIANGYVTNRAKLGIKYGVISQNQAYSMVVQLKGYPAGSIIIAEIQSDSSLVGTKAQVGDLIIAVNGKPMEDSDMLFDMVQNGSVGDKFTLTIVHISANYETEEFDVEATLVEDRGIIEAETTTENTFYNPFDFNN